VICHWDDVEPIRREAGHIVASWLYLGAAAESVTVGVRRIRIDPGRWLTPVHAHNRVEEIFLRPPSTSSAAPAISAREACRTRCVRATCSFISRAARRTRRASAPTASTCSPSASASRRGAILSRDGESWLGARRIELAPEPGPFKREALAGEPPVEEAADRPTSIVNLEDCPVESRRGRTIQSDWRRLGQTAGSVRTG
jgi:hypothetical protein